MAVSPDWRLAYPAAPAAPAALAEDATAEERAAHAAALATFARSMRVWYVARMISRPGYFPELDAPHNPQWPKYDALNTADTAVQLADDYAPGAPEGIRTEAAIRTGGWLRDVDPAAAQVTHGGEGGPDAVSYRPSAAGALRASGGMALLTRYRVRRAGAVEPAA